jgi:hypothetical protein
LKQYFPQILVWFDGVASPVVGDLLERWPSLDTLRRAHPGTLRQFFQKHNCRSAERNQERIDAIYAASSFINSMVPWSSGARSGYKAGCWEQGLVHWFLFLKDRTVIRSQK